MYVKVFARYIFFMSATIFKEWNYLSKILAKFFSAVKKNQFLYQWVVFDFQFFGRFSRAYLTP